MRFLSLFSGIGGLDLAVEHLFGARAAAHCEADPHCRRVLERHWPGVPCHPDVRQLTAEAVGAVDLICGGFPCQDLSVAGSRKGLDGERSGLWFEYLRLVRELRPGLVVIENVPPLYRRRQFRRAVEDPLVALGYRVKWTLCKASDAGAPHKRERAFMVAALPSAALPSAALPSAAVGAIWPTAVASDLGRHRPYAQGGTSLSAAAMGWPTPLARDSRGPNQGANAQGSAPLSQVASWPTPTCQDATDSAGQGGPRSRGLPRTVAWPTPAAKLGDGRGHPGPALAARRFAEGRRNLDDAVALAWPTPMAADSSRSSAVYARGNATLICAASWPTPTCGDAKASGSRNLEGSNCHAGTSLTDAVRPDRPKAGWASPAARDFRSGSGRQENGHTPQLCEQAGGTLNPPWVEALMGLPSGWTEAEGPAIAADLSRHRWPVGRGDPQPDGEAPRLCPPRTRKDRGARLRACGNAVVPQQAAFALARLLAAHADATVDPNGSRQRMFDL